MQNTTNPDGILANPVEELNAYQGIVNKSGQKPFVIDISKGSFGGCNPPISEITGMQKFGKERGRVKVPDVSTEKVLIHWLITYSYPSSPIIRTS